MKLYQIIHELGGQQFLFCDGRRDTADIKHGTTVLVETMRGLTDGIVVAGPLFIASEQADTACQMFGAYMPIRPILAVGRLADKHNPTDFRAAMPYDEEDES